jgi:[ribosomal protein S18]-alanine N-acetyltransferase
VIQIEPMHELDIGEVSRLEGRCFSNPWPQSAYRRELRNTSQNRYVVLRIGPDGDLEAITGSRGSGTNGKSLLFRLPWPQFSRRGEPELREGTIIGFSGFWHLFDEAHITTIAVDPRLRRRHLGELLLLDIVENARRRNAAYVSLEVRKSNAGAIQLYEKYGFSVRGIRPLYYTDDGEDALVMWSGDLRSEEFCARLQQLRFALSRQIDQSVLLPESADFVVRARENVETTE